jgi:ABC-2 type transport system ATP-binding protein
MSLIELEDVHKSYGSLKVLNGVEFSSAGDEVISLLGPNGAGKSTVISLMTGLRQPDSGFIKIMGQSPSLTKTRRHIGVTPQELDFPEHLKGQEVLELVQAHYPEPYSITEMSKLFGLESFIERQVGGYSGGQKRRLALACAFIGHPDIVLLDEPTTGMDIEARQMLWSAIQTFRSRHKMTLLLSTHYLDEAEAVSDRIVLLHHGQILLDGSMNDVRQNVRLQFVHYQGEPPKNLNTNWIRSLKEKNGTVQIVTHDSDELVRHLVANKTNFENLTVRSASLEEAFLNLTTNTKLDDQRGKQ